MTTVQIADIKPWPGERMGGRGRGFGIFSFLVVLTDESGGRGFPVWLNGPEGHGLFRGRGDHPHPEPAEAITAELLRAAGVTVTGVDIDELDPALTTGPRQGHPAVQVMDRLAVPAQSDLVDQFTRDVPLPRPHGGLTHLIRPGPRVRQPAR